MREAARRRRPCASSFFCTATMSLSKLVSEANDVRIMKVYKPIKRPRNSEKRRRRKEKKGGKGREEFCYNSINKSKNFGGCAPNPPYWRGGYPPAPPRGPLGQGGFPPNPPFWGKKFPPRKCPALSPQPLDSPIHPPPHLSSLKEVQSKKDKGE